ncbi:hypothetical protein HDU86_003884 [Geranomyces michiganensis]|nr:hypothetical protein HDU86_003884 [Geranomyces michiganensis]
MTKAESPAAIVAQPASNPQAPVLAFYNAHSGSGHAAALAELPSPSRFPDPTSTTSPPYSVYLYNLREDSSLNAGIEHVRTLSQAASVDAAGVKCFVLCCGGDGTVPAVMSALDKAGISKDGGGGGVVWAALPFGTANILPRFLGWGSGTSKKFVDELPSLLHTLAHEAARVAVDSMRVTVVGHRGEKSDDDMEDEEEEEVTQFSLIQTAIGLEARLGRFVEDHRASNRLVTMSFSAFNVVRQLVIQHPEINRVITNIESPTPEWSSTAHRSHSCIQINIQSIPVGGGKDHSLWNTAADAAEDPFGPQKVDDGKVELLAYPSKTRFLWNNFWATMGHGSKVEKIGQVSLPVKIQFDSNSPVLTETCMFVDGEVINLRRPRELRIESAGKVTFAIHPDNFEQMQEYVSVALKPADKDDSAISLPSAPGK